MIYDCKYSEEDYSLAEVQRDVSVFRLGSSTAFTVSPKTEFGLSCHYFYTLNLAGNCMRKLMRMGENTFQVDSYCRKMAGK